MDDLNENAERHSAGATVQHVSPFNDLPVHKNDQQLSPAFIEKWAVPYYMTIAKSGSLDWIEQIKHIKPEITIEVCLDLLGDFNWRTRLVGSYFAAVKGYRELIDIIGTHLLKSEVCCVGHVYALTLAFFNDEKCSSYLNRYLDYYLTQPALYFDQKSVLEAMLYLDKENKTDFAGKYVSQWKKLQEKRNKTERRQREEIVNILKSIFTKDDEEKKETGLSIAFFDEQVVIIRQLSQCKT